MNTIEMHGFLTGKCLPGDMRVNETTAEYLARKFLEKDDQLAAVVAERDALASENAAQRAAIDDIADVLETGTDGLLFTAVDNAVNLKVTQTAAAVREIEARGVEKFADFCSTANNGHEIHPDIEEIRLFAAELREHSQEVER